MGGACAKWSASAGREDCPESCEMLAQSTPVDSWLSEEQHPWLALKVRVRSEIAAVAALRDRGFHPFAPSVQRRRRFCDRTRLVESPVFPGYVFCQCTPRNKAKLLDSTVVKYIVSFGGKPAEVPGYEIESVRTVLHAGGDTFPYFCKGTRVRIIQGSLAGLEGLIVRQGAQHDFVVSINILQRSVAITINEEYLTIWKQIWNPGTIRAAK
jgi:transcription antitermination factor NusG